MLATMLWNDAVCPRRHLQCGMYQEERKNVFPSLSIVYCVHELIVACGSKCNWTNICLLYPSKHGMKEIKLAGVNFHGEIMLSFMARLPCLTAPCPWKQIILNGHERSHPALQYCSFSLEPMANKENLSEAYDQKNKRFNYRAVLHAPAIVFSGCSDAAYKQDGRGNGEKGVLRRCSERCC